MENFDFKFSSCALKTTVIKKILLVFSVVLLMGNFSFAQDDPVTSILTTWQTFPFSAQSSLFTASFDMVPSADSIDAQTGILTGEATGYSSLACIVSFDNTGHIKVRNGSAYSADSVVAYTAGTSYHVRMLIDVTTHTYSVYVTPEGESEIALATDYAFRTDQAGVTELNAWAMIASTDKGTHTVSNMTITEGVTSILTTWQTFPFAEQTGLFTASFDMVPNADSIDAQTGILTGEATGYSSLACIVSFDNTGHIKVRNGSAYSADSVVTYTAGTIYHVRMLIDVTTHTYSVYVTPEGESEIALATDYAFRTDQAGVTELNAWALIASTDKGTHTVSNMTITTNPVSARIIQNENFINVYPNPFTSYFNVNISSDIYIKLARIEMFDLNGKKIRNVLIDSYQTVIERGELQSGMYFYRVINNNTLIGRGKLIVQ